MMTASKDFAVSDTSISAVLIRVAKESGWAPVVVLILHEVLAGIFGHEPYVDPVIHFLGGAAAAFLLRCSVSCASGLMGRPSRVATDLLAFGLATVVAVIWELGELLSDLLLGSNIQRSAPNTLRDLALGMAGALAYLVLRRVAASRVEA
ncbi:MAG: hypothetical protein CMJ18_17385 [Phycisphaeraceae bacterium]|nr:hypothetical protein [Phycisphaeraceae bacterium]